jgi:hypothetical protein
VVLVIGGCSDDDPDPASEAGSGVPSGSGGESAGASGSGASGAAAGAGGSGAAGGGNAGGAGGGTTGGGGSGGSVPSVCADVSGNYGACTDALGWGFDGSGCSPFAGCACEPSCADFHPDLSACFAACGPGCDADAFLGVHLAMDGWGVGTHCDDVTVCAGADLVAVLQGLFPDLYCETVGGPCEGGEQRCALYYSGTVTQEQHQLLCALTFVPGVDELYCTVYGP